MSGSAPATALLREMIRIRRFEERCADLYKDEKIRGFLHLYIGEEAIAVGVMQGLTRDDAVVATYREHGHALARGIEMSRVMAEMFGKMTGTSGGRGGSMHLFDARTRFFGGNAIVGGHLPMSLGLALADRMQSRPNVTACFFGDGAVGEGEFHESLNLAALWKLPVLFCCENNRYAMGIALERAQSETDLALKAASYRIPSWPVDGMDVEAVRGAAQKACEAIRAGEGPHFLELRTYRFRAHSMFDPELYRSKEEVESWRRRDPILLLTEKLRRDSMIDEEALNEIEREVAAELEAAIAFAESSAWEPVETLTRHVTSEASL